MRITVWRSVDISLIKIRKFLRKRRVNCEAYVHVYRIWQGRDDRWGMSEVEMKRVDISIHTESIAVAIVPGELFSTRYHYVDNKSRARVRWCALERVENTKTNATSPVNFSATREIALYCWLLVNFTVGHCLRAWKMVFIVIMRGYSFRLNFSIVTKNIK